MTVCSYYLRGACKYGDRCRNEHPGASASGTFSNQTWTSSNNRVVVPYTVESMSTDITPLKDKPLWPLSSYGPAKHEPVIINGLDESPEELRLKAMTSLKAGTSEEYARYEDQKTATANQVYANARDNVKQLYEQALKVSTQPQASASALSPSVPPFSTTTSSAFGTSSMPSGFGGTATTTFGKPAFGQPAFGQAGFGGSASDPSSFGQGGQGTSAFGALTQPVSAFGQPSQTTSVFGQTTQTTSAFGQPTQPSPVFRQPSAFGAASQLTSAFSTQPTSVFGKPSQPTSVFGQPPKPTSAFGQPSQLTSAFAQPTQSTFSQPPQAISSFGQPSQPAFGQSSLIKPASGAFGGAVGGGFSAFASQPSTMASPTAPSGSPTGTTPGQPAFGSTTAPGQSAFGSTTTPVQSVFGSTPAVQSAFGTTSSPPKSVFGTSQPAPFGTSSINTLSALPSPASAIGSSSPFASSPMTVTPSSEKPGVPDFTGAKLAAKMKPGADRYLDLLPSDYEEMIPADVRAAFTGAKFEWGKVPDWIPPPGVR